MSPSEKKLLLENNDLRLQLNELISKVGAIEILFSKHNSITQFEYEAKVEELNAEVRKMVGDGPEGPKRSGL
jgi:hypothetical protein